MSLTFIREKEKYTASLAFDQNLISFHVLQHNIKNKRKRSGFKNIFLILQFQYKAICFHTTYVFKRFCSISLAVTLHFLIDNLNSFNIMLATIKSDSEIINGYVESAKVN